MEKENMREIITNSLRYRERLRIVYNLLLLGITLFYIAPDAWHRPETITPQSELAALLLLAVAAFFACFLASQMALSIKTRCCWL